MAIQCERKKLEDVAPQSDWETPVFARIKEKKTKRISPYSETELWERDEILFILKYEPYKRNKAALALFWDLDARNHEIILLKIKHIRLRERYGEGEIPYQAKTGAVLFYLLPPSPMYEIGLTNILSEMNQTQG